MSCSFIKKYAVPRSYKHLEIFWFSKICESSFLKLAADFQTPNNLLNEEETWKPIRSVKPRTLSRIKAAENSLEANIVCALSEGDRPHYKFQDARSQWGRWSHRFLYIGRYPSFEQGPHAFVIACKCRTCSLRNCIVWETYNVVSMLLKCTEAI